MNNRAFTLVELLAVLIVLSIIITITIVSVGKTVSDSSTKLSGIQKNNIENAAKTYYLKEGMNKNVTCISVNYLISNGYIEGTEVIDPKTNEVMTGSVSITYASNQYSYTYQDEGCVKIISGDKSTAGSEVSFENENFYIVSIDTNNNTTELIPKWFIEEKTNNPKQTENYSDNGVETREEALMYSEAYKNYLVSLGLNVSGIRLLNRSDTSMLFCTSNGDDFNCVSVPSNAPSWIKSPSGTYWGDSGCGIVNTDCSFEPVSSCAMGGGTCPPKPTYAIRPILTISSSEF